MSSIVELKEFDDCLPERLIYDTIESINISFPYSRFGQYCYVSNKLKEIEINLKISTEIAADEIIGCMKRSAKYHNVEFENMDVKKLYEMMINDYRSYINKLQNIKSSMYYNSEKSSIINNITAQFNRILRVIDDTIIKLSTTIKSVECEDPQLNKTNYTATLIEAPADYFSFSEEQNKLIKEGKDIFSKEMLSLDIKMLRTFKSRVLRIFNKYFGKDSYFGPLNMHDACR